MSKHFTLFVLVCTAFIISACQTTQSDIPVAANEVELSRTAPVNVLNEFIAPQAITPQAVDVASGNLFDNGGFEASLAGWNACDPNAMHASNDAYEGSTALKVRAGHCFYRSTEVISGQDLVLSCYAKILSGSGWTGMGMGFADASWTELSQAPVAVITGTSYARFDTQAVVPENAKYVSMWFYTDNPVVVDNCSLLLEEEPPPPPPTEGNLIDNGSFENATTDAVDDWSLCNIEGNLKPEGNGIALYNRGCIYQGLDAAEVAALSGNNYSYSCRVINTGGYASMTIYLRGDTNGDDRKVIGLSALPTTVQEVEITGTAPSNLSIASLGLYGEGTDFNNLKVESCSLTVESTPEPQPDNLLQNGNFDTIDNGWNSCSSNSLNITNGSLLVSNGDCIYQTVPATSGGSYHLQCEARATQTGWNTIILDFLDSSWHSTGDKSYILVRSQDLRDYAINLNTPNSAAHVAVSFYAEGQISVDACTLEKGAVLPEDSGDLLENGGFEAGSVGTSGNCSHNYTSDANKVRSGVQAVELTNGSDCLEYIFTGLTPGSYTFSCYYKVQSEFLINNEWAYRYFYNAGSSGAGLLLPIDQLDTYRLHTISPTVDDSGKVSFRFSGQGLLFDDCSFTAL